MHKHEWKFDIESGPGSVYGECECGEYMHQQELLDRLNATECLGEFEARVAKRACAAGMPPDNTAQFPRIAECLGAYAKALEGDDA